MTKILKIFFSSTVVLYTIFFILFLLAADLRQAKVQRLYELHQFSATREESFKKRTLRSRVPDEASLRLAVRYYKMLVDVFPERIRSEEMRGLCYVLLKDDQRAVRSFNKVLAQRPQFFWVEFEKGRALYRLGRQAEALKIFQDIDSRSAADLLKAALLPSVRFLSMPQQRALIVPVVEFVQEIKEHNRQMIQAGSAHPEQKDGAGSADMEELWGVHPWTIFLPSITQPWKD